MPKRRRQLTQQEIDAILFASGSESELSSEDDGWPKEQNANNSFIDSEFIAQLPDSEGEIGFNEDPDELHGSLEDQENVSPKENIINDAQEINETGFSYSNLKWTDEIDNTLIRMKPEECKGGPIHDLPVGSSAESYFKLLFTEEMCENILLNTNKYADYVKSTSSSESQKKRKWSPLQHIQELYNFFAIILIMGINKLPRLRNYWSENSALGNERIKEIMTRNRFFQIYKYFHLSDRAEEVSQNDDNFYMMQKIDPFMKELRKNFQSHFHPYKDLSIDEAMVKYKGRLGIVQYMPNKPVKRGIKVWMLCTPFLGYTCNFEVYCGKKDQMPRSTNGLGHDVVSHLTKVLDVGHCVYFDRYFTGIPLMLDLCEKGIYATGTVTGTRKHLPPNLKKIKLQKTGESKVFQCIEFPNLTCTVWKDKKEISIISNHTEHIEITA
ncbi:piggyBac transposable element-derived protein 4-like, partial [Uloborus diversus]|uniref:piggyBac transposable element-derived protein 4-like n=1 Tax=Uloborus diversus TaxID=327109 RepID=UPI00240992A2